MILQANLIADYKIQSENERRNQESVASGQRIPDGFILFLLA
jgi:hypothetical protein